MLEERKSLVRALIHSYKLLSLFAKENAADAAVSQSDMTILGRKLFTAFEHKSGKIDVVNTGICKDLSESHLYLRYVAPGDGAGGWLLYREPRSDDKSLARAALRRSRSVTECIVWSHFNGLLTSNTRTIVEGEETELSGRDIEAVGNHLRRHFPVSLPKQSGVEALSRPSKLVAAATFINFSPGGERPERVMTSARSDALSYSGWRENLVQGLDYVVVTSWGEILTHQYQGIEGLMTCLCEHLRWLGRNGHPVTVTHCCEPRYGNTIVRRIGELFDAVVGWYFAESDADRCRYVLRAGDSYHGLIRSGDHVSREFSADLDSLLTHLEQPSAKFTHTRFDRHAFDDPALTHVFGINRPGVVQFVYRLRDLRQAVVYVVDELGCLFVDEVTFYNEAALLEHYVQFFESVDFRQRSSITTGSLRTWGEEATGEFIPLELHELVPEGRDYRLERRKLSARSDRHRRFFGVKVVGEVINGETEFVVYVDEIEFSIREYGRQLFEKVSEHILARRASGELYNIYITDIDLSWLTDTREAESFQTIDYLKYKKRLEAKLNKAVKRQGRVSTPD